MVAAGGFESNDIIVEGERATMPRQAPPAAAAAAAAAQGARAALCYVSACIGGVPFAHLGSWKRTSCSSWCRRTTCRGSVGYKVVFTSQTQPSFLLGTLALWPAQLPWPWGVASKCDTLQIP